MSQLWWYVARAGGLVAWALLAAGVVWGLLLSGRLLGKRPRPAWLLDLHRYLGGLSVVFLGVHIGAVLLDTYVHFSLTQVLVPFTGSWHPAAVAWGIVGLYLLLAVEVTSLLRRHLSLKLWRRLHFLSFPLFVVATVHAMTAGTDRSSAPMQLGVFVAVAAAALLTLLRVVPERGRPPSARPRVSPRPSVRPSSPAAEPVARPSRSARMPVGATVGGGDPGRGVPPPRRAPARQPVGPRRGTPARPPGPAGRASVDGGRLAAATGPRSARRGLDHAAPRPTAAAVPCR